MISRFIEIYRSRNREILAFFLVYRNREKLETLPKTEKLQSSLTIFDQILSGGLKLVRKKT
jgi:hypothetical protein